MVIEDEVVEIEVDEVEIDAVVDEITEFVVDDKTGGETVVVEDPTELVVVDDAPGAGEVDDISGKPDVEELGPVTVVEDTTGDPALVVDEETAVVEGTACVLEELVLEDIAIVVLVVVVTATSQFAPVKPSGQTQLKPEPSSKHSKGSAHGLDEQGVISQSSPE